MLAFHHAPRCADMRGHARACAARGRLLPCILRRARVSGPPSLSPRLQRGEGEAAFVMESQWDEAAAPVVEAEAVEVVKAGGGVGSASALERNGAAARRPGVWPAALTLYALAAVALEMMCEGCRTS